MIDIIIVVIQVVVVKEVGDDLFAHGMSTQWTFHIQGAHLDETRFMKKVFAFEGDAKTLFLTDPTLLRLFLMDHERFVKDAGLAFLIFLDQATTIPTQSIPLREIPNVQDGLLDIFKFLTSSLILLRSKVSMNIILYSHTYRIMNTTLPIDDGAHQRILIRSDA
jgi:hypothetical protein